VAAMNRIEIGKALAQARKTKQLTQREVQKLTNINKSTLSEIENGKFTGSLDILERYTHYLDYELAVVPRASSKPRLPRWDELNELFSEDS